MRKRRIKTRTAQGHIEMIVSFIIFIGFVLAIFLYVYPMRQQKVTYSSLEDVQEKILNNLSFQYSSVSLILNESRTNCFAVDNSFGLSSNILARDINGMIKPATLSSGKIYIDFSSGTYYKLYFSNELNNYTLSNTNCDNLTNNAFSFGVLDTENIILYENIALLNDSYLKNYAGLKNSLKLKNDFEFIVFDNNRSMLFNESLSVHKLKNINVLSREIPLRALDRNAAYRDVIFNLRVW